MSSTDLHKKNSLNFFGIFIIIYRYKHLILTLSRREIAARYRGSSLGLAWSFLTPLIMLIIYTFIFSVVFQAKWGTGPSESRMDFAIILFVGLIVHALFAECINAAPGLVISNVVYVKRVVFPLEILPIVSLISAVFHCMVSMCILFCACFLAHGMMPLTALWFPLILLPLIVGTLGIAWIFAALGVFLRDLGQTVGIITSIMLFMSPVFFSVSVLPHSFQRWIYLNPLTFIIEEMRAAVLWGNHPDLTGLLLYSLVSLIVLWGGFCCFQKIKKGFADVL